MWYFKVQSYDEYLLYARNRKKKCLLCPYFQMKVLSLSVETMKY